MQLANVAVYPLGSSDMTCHDDMIVQHIPGSVRIMHRSETWDKCLR